MRILVSGASIAGPVLAYWLTRYGYSVTVVERAPALRKTGGHAVDLFRPAVDISEKMGVLPRIEERATGTHRMTVYREGSRRPVRADLSKIFSGASERHVEILRDDLSEIYYDAARDDVEYVFGDSITAISPDGEVRFENAAPRRFDLVVGAYVLAGELARAGGDHARAFRAYERVMAEHVRGSREVALSAAKTLIPTSRLGVWGLAQGARLISALPAGPSRALVRLTTKSARLYHSVALDDYPPSSAASAVTLEERS
ncbi:FAD-dependent monooxygenase [Streptomyces sp. NPDC059649]|uniref:FAD-dependent monooxygenase n=1 Tax=Streptomyces sp. NPDC059649 TaxID=3346895 RepID=UPI00368DFDAE